MLETQELRQLVAVAEQGTLSRAAAALHITQPVLSRSMKRIEEKLGTALFSRSGGNRIALNETGFLAVEEAKKVLEALDRLERRVEEETRKNSTVTVGSCAPAPLWALVPTLAEKLHGRPLTVLPEYRCDAELATGLASREYTLVITEAPIHAPGILSKEYMTERLYVSFPLTHPLAGRKSVSPEELRGETMLLFDKIGIWKSFCQEMLSEVNFITLQDRHAMEELINATGIPCFATNIVSPVFAERKSRKEIPLFTPGAVKHFYLNVSKRDADLL